VSSNVDGVPSDAPNTRVGESAGRQRSERLRARRDAAGMAQVSGWVPKDRRAYAREVIVALARGANSLPPDPVQAAALEAAQADAAAARVAEGKARAALAEAEQHARALATDLDAARAAAVAAQEAQEASSRVVALAVARAEASERERDDIRDKLQTAETRLPWVIRVIRAVRHR
jgi:hypothetical protein